VASWNETIGRDGFVLFAPQARNGFVGRQNCFVAVSSVSPKDGYVTATP
jgi:hypothetical protein